MVPLLNSNSLVCLKRHQNMKRKKGKGMGKMGEGKRDGRIGGRRGPRVSELYGICIGYLLKSFMNLPISGNSKEQFVNYRHLQQSPISPFNPRTGISLRDSFGALLITNSTFLIGRFLYGQIAHCTASWRVCRPSLSLLLTLLLPLSLLA
jgi:hypothetical protein